MCSKIVYVSSFEVLTKQCNTFLIVLQLVVPGLLLVVCWLCSQGWWQAGVIVSPITTSYVYS